MKKTPLAIILLLLLNSGITGAEEAVIYYNEACGGCTHYIKNDLIPLLNELGIENITLKDYINDKKNRVELNRRSEELGVPVKLQGHFTIFIGDRIILQGHIPKHIVSDLFKEENQVFSRIVVLQDKMGDPMDPSKNYKVWAYRGEIKEYSVRTPVTEYLEWFDENRDKLEMPPELGDDVLALEYILPLVLITGFLDGLNPCAFAVLLFFIVFLFTIKKTRMGILWMGIVYIAAIYLAYFLIGMGLFQAVMISGEHHFMAKVGAYLVIILGLINIANYFFPKFPIKLKIPTASKELLQKWIYKATLPSAFILGFLVGLCTFPCSGGIYVAIIGLLAAKATYLEGIGYIILYNIMFVMPLVIILAVTSNKRITERITRMEQSESKHMRLLSGLVMIALGVIILLWFV